MKYILFTIAFLLASNCLKAQGQFEKVIGLTGAQGFHNRVSVMPTLKVKYLSDYIPELRISLSHCTNLS